MSEKKNDKNTNEVAKIPLIYKEDSIVDVYITTTTKYERVFRLERKNNFIEPIAKYFEITGLDRRRVEFVHKNQIIDLNLTPEDINAGDEIYLDAVVRMPIESERKKKIKKKIKKKKENCKQSLEDMVNLIGKGPGHDDNGGNGAGIGPSGISG